MFAYFTMSLSGSMFAQENLLLPKSLSKITIDLPSADIVPPKGKFGSVNTCRFSPTLIGPKRDDMSPT